MQTKLIRIAMVIAVVFAAARNGDAQSDASVILEFQRAADSYAFAHRQDERRGAPSAQLVEGRFFTPLVAAAFRARIHAAGSACAPEPGEGGSIVPHVNAPDTGTTALPPCLAAALPRLPPELDYRAAGVALVLADAQHHVVVDVLHGAFP
jgi:hypothetical protein